jgi:hypothetical protein
MPVGCGGIHFMVCMVYQMDHPQRFHLVLYVMWKISPEKVEQQYPQDNIKP